MSPGTSLTMGFIFGDDITWFCCVEHVLRWTCYWLKWCYNDVRTHSSWNFLNQFSEQRLMQLISFVVFFHQMRRASWAEKSCRRGMSRSKKTGSRRDWAVLEWFFFWCIFYHFQFQLLWFLCTCLPYLCSIPVRGRLKVRKDAGPVSSNLEIYLNHQIRIPTLNGQFKKSGRSSPPQPGVARGQT